MLNSARAQLFAGIRLYLGWCCSAARAQGFREMQFNTLHSIEFMWRIFVILFVLSVPPLPLVSVARPSASSFVFIARQLNPFHSQYVFRHLVILCVRRFFYGFCSSVISVICYCSRSIQFHLAALCVFVNNHLATVQYYIRENSRNDYKLKHANELVAELAELYLASGGGTGVAHAHNEMSGHSSSSC